MSSVLERKCPFKKAQMSYQKAQTSSAGVLEWLSLINFSVIYS
jgi:hypothetical protein